MFQPQNLATSLTALHICIAGKTAHLSIIINCSLGYLTALLSHHAPITKHQRQLFTIIMSPCRGHAHHLGRVPVPHSPAHLRQRQGSAQLVPVIPQCSAPAHSGGPRFGGAAP